MEDYKTINAINNAIALDMHQRALAEEVGPVAETLRLVRHALLVQNHQAQDLTVFMPLHRAPGFEKLMGYRVKHLVGVSRPFVGVGAWL